MTMLMGTALAWFDRAFRTIGIVCLLAVMVIVFCDVGARYLMNAPFPWSYELIGMYLMPAIFYFAVSDTLAANHHIAVDLLRPRRPPAMIRIVETLGSAAMACVFMALVWLFFGSAFEKFRSDSVVMGVVEWPSWIPDFIVGLGSLLVGVRLLGRAAGHLLSLLTGRAIVELPSSGSR